MDCASFDLTAYHFGELSAGDQRAFEQHARRCAACAGELERILLTETALRSVPDQEPPRRIAFVSDKVFEPKWYRRPLGAAWGYAAMTALAGAIVFHAMWAQPPVTLESPLASVAHRSYPVAAPAPAPGLSAATVEGLVKEAEARGEKRMRQLLADSEKRHEFEVAAMSARFAVGFEELSKKYYNLYKMTASAADVSGPGAGR